MSNRLDEDLITLERVELSDSDSEEAYEYKALDEISLNGDDDEDDDEDDFQSVLASIKRASAPESPEKSVSKRKQLLSTTETSSKASAQVRPSVVDDFIRNFFIKMGMTRSLDAFNTEWYEFMAKGKLEEEDIGVVPDIYVQNQTLDDQVKSLRGQIAKMEEITAKAKGTWDKFRKERDFHRMHHKRVVQEKEKLVVDLKRLKKHFSSYEPTIKELRAKYEVAMKEKMMMRLERDRLGAKLDTLEARGQSQEIAQAKPTNTTKENATTKAESKTKKKKKIQGETMMPSEAKSVNPYLNMDFQPINAMGIQLSKTFRGHLNAVSDIAFHPTNPIVATVSDDETWKLWSVPHGELIMSGEGHRSWLASVDFHPQGTHLVTSSGDHTVKLWDFLTASCAATLTDHTHPVWATAFHHAGDFLVTASMDHTAKLWDVHTTKCRLTFRGHVDSVNATTFLPFSTTVSTAAGDKTVSLWDMRSGLCVQTFYGHGNAVNGVTATRRGDTLASCDADGVVKLWDIRMVAERATVKVGEHPLNRIALDASGQVGVVASDDGTIKVFLSEATSTTTTGTTTTAWGLVNTLQGHEDAVQSVVLDSKGQFMASAGSDCTFRLWSL